MKKPNNLPKLAEDLNRLSKIPVGRMVEIPLSRKPLHKFVGTIDLKPTPKGYALSLILILQNSTSAEDREWAKQEIIRLVKAAATITPEAWGKEK